MQSNEINPERLIKKVSTKSGRSRSLLRLCNKQAKCSSKTNDEPQAPAVPSLQSFHSISSVLDAIVEERPLMPDLTRKFQVFPLERRFQQPSETYPRIKPIKPQQSAESLSSERLAVTN